MLQIILSPGADFCSMTMSRLKSDRKGKQEDLRVRIRVKLRRDFNSARICWKIKYSSWESRIDFDSGELEIAAKISERYEERELAVLSQSMSKIGGNMSGREAI